MNQNMQGNRKCSCPHHSMLAIFIVLFGLLFLFNALSIVQDGATSVIWPIIVLAAGLTMLTGGRCHCCPAA